MKISEERIYFEITACWQIQYVHKKSIFNDTCTVEMMCHWQVYDLKRRVGVRNCERVGVRGKVQDLSLEGTICRGFNCLGNILSLYNWQCLVVHLPITRPVITLSRINCQCGISHLRYGNHDCDNNDIPTCHGGKCPSLISRRQHITLLFPPGPHK